MDREIKIIIKDGSNSLNDEEIEGYGQIFSSIYKTVYVSHKQQEIDKKNAPEGKKLISWDTDGNPEYIDEEEFESLEAQLDDMAADNYFKNIRYQYSFNVKQLIRILKEFTYEEFEKYSLDNGIDIIDLLIIELAWFKDRKLYDVFWPKYNNIILEHEDRGLITSLSYEGKEEGAKDFNLFDSNTFTNLIESLCDSKSSCVELLWSRRSRSKTRKLDDIL